MECELTCRFSRVRLFTTLWTVARQAPLSMGFSKQEYWNGLPFPSLGHLPNPGTEHGPPALMAGNPGKTLKYDIQVFNLLMFFLQSEF